MSEEQASYGVTPKSVWTVKAWVRDAELEGTLNALAADGWSIEEMFRNAPGLDGQETTTVIGEKYE